MAWPTSPTTLGSSTTFYGRGWGHGVGLNQYGAKGRALAGQTAEQILAAYYRGAKAATVSGTQNVRVLVLGGYSAVRTAPLIIHGRDREWTVDGVAKRFPAGGVLKLYRTTSTIDGLATTTWRLRVYAADATTLLHSAIVSGSVVVRPASSWTRLQVDSRPSSYDTYRGLLKIRLGASSATVINHVGLDLYVRGVVPVEMDPAWPAEALRAQTAAARSYAVRRLHPGVGSFDLYDDTRSQVYRGVEAERSATSSIIRQYPGQVITVNGVVVNAFFFATGGGSTENNEYVFVSSSGAVGTAVSYLRGIPDRRSDGRAWDAGAPRWSWTTSTLSRAQLGTMFRGDARTNVGDLTKLDLTRRGVSGRLYRVTLYGSAGSKTVSADVFRAVYNARRPAGTLALQSNLFDTKPLAGS
jgi:stage II sporulation protein D